MHQLCHTYHNNNNNNNSNNNNNNKIIMHANGNLFNEMCI